MGEFLSIGWILLCSGFIGYIVGLAHCSFIGKKGISDYKAPTPPPKKTKLCI